MAKKTSAPADNSDAPGLEQNGQQQVDIWDGIQWRTKYRPAKFNHRGRSYVLANLTIKEVTKLSQDDSFLLFGQVK
jgi:hypothetical protein